MKFLLGILFSINAYAQIDIGIPEIPVPMPEHTLPDSSKQIDMNLFDKTPLTPQCIKDVSQHYGIHPDILFAILLVEGGTVGQTNKGNSNGTKDLSLFQINEINLPELKSEFGIERDEVLNNGCLGAAIAARHLLRSIIGAKRPTNRGEYLSMLARYHSKAPDANAVYAAKLEEKFQLLNQMDQLK